MTTDTIEQTVQAINDIVCRELWFDFDIYSFSNFNLQVVGSIDTTYGYTLSIHFTDVLYLSARTNWGTNTQVPCLYILSLEEARGVHLEVLFEAGYTIFKFLVASDPPVYIAATGIEFAEGYVRHERYRED